jgi:hypothetical protein
VLTDIFAYRYLGQPIWQNYTELEQRLLNQAFGIVKEALPYWTSDGKVDKINEEKWKQLHDRLARELGVSELSPRYYSYTQKDVFGKDWPQSGWFTWDHVCEQFVNARYPGTGSADRFIKERVSFVELALRQREGEVGLANYQLPGQIAKANMRDTDLNKRINGIRVPGREADALKALNRTVNAAFEALVVELNERFRRAGVPLTYHNGFIQLAMDQQIEKQIGKPFWDLVSDPLWKNVDIDMKEALDRRDANDKDPALFAAKALESAIKIVSDTKGWTRGTEGGAAQYVDNLVSKSNGSFLAVWEGEMLKDYFRKVRNSLGHGPGSEPMPQLTIAQTDWAIEAAMSWVRSLVRRM